MYSGIGASHGYGIGTVCLISEHELEFEPKKIEDTAAEKQRFRDSVSEFIRITADMAERVRINIGEKESEILMGQLVMINDPSMSAEMEKMIDAGSCAESAVTAVVVTCSDVVLTHRRHPARPGRRGPPQGSGAMKAVSPRHRCLNTRRCSSDSLWRLKLWSARTTPAPALSGLATRHVRL